MGHKEDMAFELHAYKVDEDSRITVRHTFYGETREEADEHFQAHVRICPKFGPAEREGKIISFYREIDELPTVESAEFEAAEAEGEEEIEEDEEDDE